MSILERLPAEVKHAPVHAKGEYVKDGKYELLGFKAPL